MTRREREQETVEAMVRLWCRHRHGTRALCPECWALLAYSGERLAHCRFGDAKPTCKDCPVHCYRSDEREAMRRVMRWAGPRLMWRHPYLALRHVMDGWGAGKKNRRGG